MTRPEFRAKFKSDTRVAADARSLLLEARLAAEDSFRNLLVQEKRAAAMVASAQRTETELAGAESRLAQAREEQRCALLKVEELKAVGAVLAAGENSPTPSPSVPVVAPAAAASATTSALGSCGSISSPVRLPSPAAVILSPPGRLSSHKSQ
eukprot:Hpha_TRINITY_DN7369_c0_g1::TRINITY_DN7369_c0_g1_i2::g.10101::m.10101